jgi:hypothetical protein
MSGFFRRFFAPRWQHPDAQMRRQAVARLDPSHPDQREALEHLAIDPDPTVREGALERLDDPGRLMTLLDETPASPELRARIITLLSGRAGHLDLASRIALTEQIGRPDILEEIAYQGDNQQLRLAALAALDDEEVLIRQACDNGIAAVRHAAAARVQSEAGLMRLAQSAKRDHQVMRQARERLNRMRADSASVAAAQERRGAILASLERHASSSWEPLYGGRFRHLMREWDALEDMADPGQERRYQEV